MSSQALYRKWRSQTFDELVGQAHIVQALRNAIASNRIGHAYLFTGPRGVGKTSAARLLSKAVNCLAEPELRPCGQCEACVTITEGRAVDVIEMDAASHTSVEDAREIIERVQFRPSQFRTKVYVVDEAHMLSAAAFNALLKTLEEPPDHAMFILATTEFHKVPATIVSRCQRFVFNRHTLHDTVEHLEWVAAQENIGIEREAAEAIARAATGSMRDAMSVLDQLIGYGDPVITLERVQSLLGATAAQEVQALVGAFVQHDVSAALSIINNVSDQGADLRQFTRDTVAYLRNLMLLKSGGDQALIDATGDTLHTMQNHAQALELSAILAWLKIFSTLDQQLRTTPYGQLPLEMAVVEAMVAPAPVAQTAPTPTPARPTIKPTQTPPAVRSTPQPAMRPPVVPSEPAQPTPEPTVVQATPEPVVASASSEPAAPRMATAVVVPETDDGMIVLAESEIRLAEIEAIWDKIIDDLKPYNPRFQAVLKSCEPIGMDETMLIIGAPSPFHAKQLEDQGNRRLLEDVISKTLGQAMLVRGEHVNKEQQSKARDARRQREELMKDHAVKAARNIFDARIVGVQEDG